MCSTIWNLIFYHPRVHQIKWSEVFMCVEERQGDRYKESRDRERKRVFLRDKERDKEIYIERKRDMVEELIKS